MAFLSTLNAATNLENMRVGLLGGSFNPPHQGHVHISEIALRRLGLHQLWWLVSPQNPLKSTEGMSPQTERAKACKELIKARKICIKTFEANMKTHYTVDTLNTLVTRYPSATFIWVMGADNLENLHLWYHWRQILHVVPVAVIARPGYHIRASFSKAALAFGQARRDQSDAVQLGNTGTPAWSLLIEKLTPLSSSEIRKNRRDS